MPTAIVAEDEPILRTQLEGKLRKLWPELEIIASVEDGAAALEALEARAPDFMFLDIQMPEVSGVEVARRVAGRSHVVFVVVVIALAIVLAVLYGLGFLFIGLAIFIPLVILVSLFPVLAPVILVGLGIWWLVRRSRQATTT